MGPRSTWWGSQWRCRTAAGSAATEDRSCRPRGGCCCDRDGPGNTVAIVLIVLIETFLSYKRTSWIQLTSRVWIPPPQGMEHRENSDTFHLGGQGWSWHVCTLISGRVDTLQLTGETGVSNSLSTHRILDSWIPEIKSRAKEVIIIIKRLFFYWQRTNSRWRKGG